MCCEYPKSDSLHSAGTAQAAPEGSADGGAAVPAEGGGATTRAQPRPPAPNGNNKGGGSTNQIQHGSHVRVALKGPDGEWVSRIPAWIHAIQPAGVTIITPPASGGPHV
eukprot:1192954-Prorocentrum_minimum.AAC.4